MDDHMTARGFAQEDWFAAAHPTIADIVLFPAFALSRDFGIDHDEYPALRRWARRFRMLPGFKTMPGIPDYH
jgi:glutathione S-transferase